MTKKDDAKIYFNRAFDLFLKDGFTSSVHNIRKAVKLDPTNSGYRGIFGIFLLSTNKFAEAEQQFRKAITLNPNSMATLKLLNKCLEAQGKPTE